MENQPCILNNTDYNNTELNNIEYNNTENEISPIEEYELNECEYAEWTKFNDNSVEGQTRFTSITNESESNNNITNMKLKEIILNNVDMESLSTTFPKLNLEKELNKWYEHIGTL